MVRRKGRHRAKIQVTPRWIIRKNKEGAQQTFLGVELWNPTHSTYNPKIICFATRSDPSLEFSIDELYNGQHLPAQLKPGDRLIAILRDEDLSRSALLGLDYLTVQFHSGKTLDCDALNLEQFRSDYLAELKNPRPSAMPDWA